MANQVIDVETIHVRPLAICREFFDNASESNCYVKTTQLDIDHDVEEYMSLHNTDNKPWEGLIEVYTLLKKIAEEILSKDVLLMHGAAIAINDSAFIFTGNSGVGKSTHIAKWIACCFSR